MTPFDRAALRAPAPSEAVTVDAAKAVAIAARLTRFAHELGPEHPRYITVLNAALALEVSATRPAPARGVTVTEAMVDEMAKQAALGHTRFCVGVHENGEAEWIEWPEAFTRLLTPDAEGGA